MASLLQKINELYSRIDNMNASTITTTGDVNIGGFLYPKLPCFSATYSGSESDITSTQNVPYNTIEIDNQNGYNTSNYTYTIQTAGYWYVHWAVTQSDGYQFIVLLQKNGVTQDRSRAGEEGGGRTEGAQRMRTLYCNAGDVLRIILTLGGLQMNSFSSWGGFLLST